MKEVLAGLPMWGSVEGGEALGLGSISWLTDVGGAERRRCLGEIRVSVFEMGNRPLDVCSVGI